MRSALAVSPVISLVQIPAGLSMKRKKRWNGIGSFAKAVRFASMNVRRMP
jgi:hypothetical protein